MKKYLVETGYGSDWNRTYNCYNAHPSNEDGVEFESYDEALDYFNSLVSSRKGGAGEIVSMYESDENGEYDFCCCMIESFETDPHGNEI